MTIYTKIKTLAAAAIIATGLGSVAGAATIATAVIDGEYLFDTPQGEPTTLSIAGSFSASLLAPVPAGEQDYTFSASLFHSGGGADFDVDGSITETVDLNDVAGLGALLIALLVDNAGTSIPFDYGTFEYGGSLTGPTEGNYNINVYFDVAAGTIPLGQILAPLFAGTPLDGLVPGNFTLPNNTNGYFKADFAISTAAVPLPAGSVLLLTAIGGLGLMRRRMAA